MRTGRENKRNQKMIGVQCFSGEKRKVMNKSVGAGKDQIKGTSPAVHRKMNKLGKTVVKDKVAKSFGSR